MFHGWGTEKRSPVVIRQLTNLLLGACKILEILQWKEGLKTRHFYANAEKCQACVPSFTAVNYYSTYRQNVNSSPPHQNT